MHKERLEQIAKKFLIDSGFATSVSFSYDEDLNILWCTPETEHARLLTERGGEGLQALNHIVRRIVEKEFGEELPSTSLSIDVLGFGKKHVESLRTMAHMLAERARYFKSSIEVDPMSPYDRRIVHEYVSKMTDLVTESVGEGQKRHIVIRYKEKGDSNI